MVTFRDSDFGHPGDDPAPESGGYAVIVNGHSLVHALHPQLEQLFLELASQCTLQTCYYDIMNSIVFDYLFSVV